MRDRELRLRTVQRLERQLDGLPLKPMNTCTKTTVLAHVRPAERDRAGGAGGVEIDLNAGASEYFGPRRVIRREAMHIALVG
jgi:hypothetical protein